MSTGNICNYNPIGSLSIRAIDSRFRTVHRYLCYLSGAASGGLTSVSTQNSATVTWSGDGTSGSPLIATATNVYTFSTGLTNTAGTVTANLSTGVAGGQSAIGGTAASQNLQLVSTSHATKGKILFGTSAYDEAANRLGIGIATPGTPIHMQGSGVQEMQIIGTTATSFSRITFNNSADGTIGGQLLFGGNSTGFLPGGLIVSSSKNSLAVVCEQGDIRFTRSTTINGSNEHARFTNGGNLGIGVTVPTAVLHLKAGTATVGSAPLKLTAGTNLTTPEDGTFEFDGTNLYFTVGGVRRTVTLV